MTRPSPTPDGQPADYKPYDKGKLSYSGTFTNPVKVNTIRAVEWMTGKLTLLRLIRQFERSGVPEGQKFWGQAMRIMGIELQTPADQLAHIPAKGPLVVVANHPHGMVDGMVMAELIGRIRTDYKILTRSLLTEINEIRQFMIPVPFPHEENAQKNSLEMRRETMDHLANGGVIILFPAGAVASAPSAFGTAVEKVWNPFTAKMILRSGANVLPIFFPGSNSRLYHVADQFSATIRQGLLLHEVVHALNKPQAPVIGPMIDTSELEEWKSNPRGFMAWLRDRTLALGEAQD
ncbi:MAG: lysophospholipid acyltransferase family protein [Paracoccaceae bacterium]|nr:lysophospholipid acyltransferase family protein [Paracoccaceae bacterium]